MRFASTHADVAVNIAAMNVHGTRLSIEKTG